MLPSIAPKGDTLRNLVDGAKKFLGKNTLSGGDTNLNSSCLTIYNQGGQKIVPAIVISSAITFIHSKMSHLLLLTFYMGKK